MHKALIFLATFVVLTATAADLDLDVDLMQAIEDSNKSMSSNISLHDAKRAGADARELQAMFAKVEAYFVRKGGADNAVELAHKSGALSVSIAQSIADNKFDAASDAATALSRTCRTCHTFYKKE